MTTKYKPTTEYKLKKLGHIDRILFSVNVNKLRNGRPLSDINVYDLPLVGPNMSKFLKNKGVSTLEDFVKFNVRELRAADFSGLNLVEHQTTKQKIEYIAKIKSYAKLICSTK